MKCFWTWSLAIILGVSIAPAWGQSSAQNAWTSQEDCTAWVAASYYSDQAKKSATSSADVRARRDEFFQFFYRVEPELAIKWFGACPPESHECFLESDDPVPHAQAFSPRPCWADEEDGQSFSPTESNTWSSNPADYYAPEGDDIQCFQEIELLCRRPTEIPAPPEPIDITVWIALFSDLAQNGLKAEAAAAPLVVIRDAQNSLQHTAAVYGCLARAHVESYYRSWQQSIAKAGQDTQEAEPLQFEVPPGFNWGPYPKEQVAPVAVVDVAETARERKAVLLGLAHSLERVSEAFQRWSQNLKTLSENDSQPWGQPAQPIIGYWTQK